MSQQGDGTLIFKELSRQLSEKNRQLRDDMRALAEGGAFYRTKALKELREACADLARLDDDDLDARIDRVDTWLSRYQCSRPDWEEAFSELERR